VLQDVLDSLQVKLGITAMSSFSLVVEHVKSLKRNKLTLLNPKDTLSKVGRLNPLYMLNSSLFLVLLFRCSVPSSIFVQGHSYNFL
jgi:hypothetical protein